MTARGSHFSVLFSRALGKVIVHIHGALAVDTAPELIDRLVDVIDGQGNLDLIVDLKGTTSVDAAGFSVLVDALRRIREKGGEFTLSGPTGDVTQALKAAGLDKVFAITPAWAHPAHGGGHSIVTSLHLRRSS